MEMVNFINSDIYFDDSNSKSNPNQNYKSNLSTGLPWLTIKLVIMKFPGIKASAIES